MNVKRKSRPYKPDWADKALTAAALIVEAQAAELVPVDTGRLKGSISHISHINKSNKTDGIKGTAASGEAYVGSNVEYAPYQEYGTRFMSGKAYMRPAIDATKGDIKRVIAKYWKGQAFGC